MYNPAVEIIKYLLLGIIQGLTEFLPISSSGHLLLAEHWLGLNPPGIALEVAVHFATLVSVIIVYWKDLREIFIKGNWRYVALLALATAVTVAILLPVKSQLEVLTESTQIVRLAGGMLLLTAIWLFAADYKLLRAGSASQPGWFAAVLIGLVQAVAGLPGISRSGATIGAAIQAGLNRESAARFSFLLSIPVIAGAAVLVVPEAITVLREGTLNLAGLASAMLAALLSGIAAIHIVLWTLRRARLLWFGVYCVLIGGAALYFGG